MENQQRDEVLLYGNWASAFTDRVELALKLKGTPYEYMEEDLKNKSYSLIHNNPVHKKVPVLVHNGKAIAESLVILEYIDDFWSTTPKLLPEDPYERAKIRFWANYYDQKVIQSTYPILYSQGKEREKAMADFREILRMFEEGIEKDFPKNSPFLNGETLGFLDIVVAANSCTYRAFEEALGVSYGLDKHQAFFSWVTAFESCPLIMETLPPHDKLVALIREMSVQPPKI